ncbi:hypothetical protein LCGC14_0455890 [marine sediment metagenome]|uniref:YspA cpYpsA-related SLOG domain-containing protein n=1 Tax=marine sediment metagenome TaxID=412755 RepID=A0A0F9VQG8_9ZZZZ
MRVLVCGDRHWTDRGAILNRLRELPPGAIIIHGAAKGADTIAGEVAKSLGFAIEAYLADWAQYGRAAGPIRNAKMLQEGKPDLVIAYHADIEASKGTKSMVRLARAAGIPVEVLP